MQNLRTKGALFQILLGGFLWISCQPELPAPKGLMVELLRAPGQAVITDPEPEFSWIFPASGIRQQAYEIRVASHVDLLSQDNPDVWQSPRLETAQSANVAYSGPALQPNSSYWWQVRVWDEAGTSSQFSQPQQFHTGSFDRSGNEWFGQSNWINQEDSLWLAEDRQMASFQEKEPVTFLQNPEGNFFADFGKAAFGTLQLSVTAGETDTLTIYLGERSLDDQTVDKNTGRSNIAIHEHRLAIQPGTHQYQVNIPRHVGRYPHSQKLAPFYPEVIPFRYVEVTGDHDFEVTQIQQLALYYYFDDQASHFTSSNKKLNQVWDLCKYTLKATPFLGVYCDGNRERMPYEADAYIQQLGHYAVDREYSAARYTILFLLSHASWPTEWQMHTVKMARDHYFYTGELEFIEQIYDHLKVKTLIDLAEDNYLISTRKDKATPELMAKLNYTGDVIKDIVDWPRGTPEGEEQASMAGPTPEGERDGYVFTDFNTVVNAFHYNTLICMQELAEAVDKPKDASFYRERAELVKQSIIDHFFDPERGVFTDGIETDHASLHANIFPVAFGIIPDGFAGSMAKHIKSRGMACSVYGAQYLLEALYNLGEAEYALELMTSESKRSWLNMIRMGSTMTTEAWDEYYKPNLTWNHAWGAAPANIIPRRMMGIQPLEPGFKRFKVQPQTNGLDQVGLKLPTIKGAIETELKIEAESWQLNLKVPGNALAEIHLPDELSQVEVKTLNGDTKEISVNSTDDPEMLRLPGGNYHITAKKVNNEIPTL
ncbi:MAG: alpha-L-rhamnosidase C-terminal domain-containing protein [Candidatus Cyclobacteriaceae bacterium M3_2C_046]